MKSLFLAVSVVALTIPMFARSEHKETPKRSRITLDALRKREPSALKQLGLWLVTGVLPQIIARKGGHITVASANVASVGTALHAGGEIFENETAQDWGRNCWFYAIASELLRKLPYVGPGLDKAYGYTTADHAKSGFEQKVIEENVNADRETLGVAKAIIATTLLKLAIEKGPALFSAAQDCAQSEAKLPTAAAAA